MINPGNFQSGFNISKKIWLLTETLEVPKISIGYLDISQATDYKWFDDMTLFSNMTPEDLVLNGTYCWRYHQVYEINIY